jgi:hypothetical protein
MPWYLFALVDAVPPGRPGRGLSGPLAARSVAGAVAIVERRADVPPVEFDTLTKHNAIVTRLAGASPAILPVRFGTLLEFHEIEDALAEREEELAEAFARVRGRVQFTWRRTARGSGVQARSARAAAAGAASGTEYLRRAARAANPRPPAAFRTIRATLKPLVAGERCLAATPALPDSLYHLVERVNIERYREQAEPLATAAIEMSGPFPPFAFVPEFL